MRVVSLLPSATEIVCALGAGDQLVGVSHECDHPPAVAGLPALTSARLPAGGTSGEVDRSVRDLLRAALAIYDLDVEAPELYETMMSDRGLSMDAYRKKFEDASREHLEAAVPASAREYSTIDTMIATGKPYREILRIAGEQNADLIVMGVQGRGAVDLLLFGSTTQHVLRQATCPVLTLRKP